ncbi:MAG: superoxide dismutase family protein [Balneolaceae bacterium]|nr:superoxide dismutase family protein [Balneolaceae bacterium]
MRYLTLLTFFLFMAAGCAEPETSEHQMSYEDSDLNQLVTVVHATEGNEVEGTVMFTQTAEGVRVQANISGLDEDGVHGFHIHEFGDCRADDATSAGGHYNPTGMDHGGPMDENRHMGDMGNLEANEDGVAELDYIDEKIELSGVNSILGLAVVVHEQRDDLESQPVGDAGGRIGCGIIGVANPDY